MKHLEFADKLKALTKEDKEELASESKFTKKNREPKEAISLSGVAITTAGKISKSNFLNFLNLDLDNYDDIQFTPEEAKKVAGHLAKLRTGSTAMVPIFCGGPACPFSNRCPLHQMGKAPIGRVCPIESNLIKEYTISYFTEFDVDPDNWTEVAYIQELAEIDIYLMRLNMSLSRPENAELVVDQVVGFSGRDDTEPVIQKQVSPYLQVRERLLARRSRIVKLMVGDRQERYKKQAALKEKSGDSISSQLAQARANLDGLLRAKDQSAVESKTIKTPNDFMETIELDDDK